MLTAKREALTALLAPTRECAQRARDEREATVQDVAKPCNSFVSHGTGKLYGLVPYKRAGPGADSAVRCTGGCNGARAGTVWDRPARRRCGPGEYLADALGRGFCANAAVRAVEPVEFGFPTERLRGREGASGEPVPAL